MVLCIRQSMQLHEQRWTRMLHYVQCKLYFCIVHVCTSQTMVQSHVPRLDLTCHVDIPVLVTDSKGSLLLVWCLSRIVLICPVRLPFSRFVKRSNPLSLANFSNKYRHLSSLLFTFALRYAYFRVQYASVYMLVLMDVAL